MSTASLRLGQSRLEGRLPKKASRALSAAQRRLVRLRAASRCETTQGCLRDPSAKKASLIEGTRIVLPSCSRGRPRRDSWLRDAKCPGIHRDDRASTRSLLHGHRLIPSRFLDDNVCNDDKTEITFCKKVGPSGQTIFNNPAAHQPQYKIQSQTQVSYMCLALFMSISHMTCLS